MNIYKHLGKRFVDIIFSLSGFLLCFPIFIIICFFIKLDSSGSIFFIQKRMGLDGELFPLIKFRTMYINPEKEIQLFEPGTYERVTPLGRILRRTKLDELPELINIFWGNMSLVGPRPEVPKYSHFYLGKFRKILSIKPGLTDEASLKYKNEEEILRESRTPEKFYCQVILPDKLNINLQYVEKGLSLKKDIKIILFTLKKLFFNLD